MHIATDNRPQPTIAELFLFLQNKQIADTRRRCPMLTTRLFIADSLLDLRPCPPIQASNLDDHFGCLQSSLSQITHRNPPRRNPSTIFANTYYSTSLSKRVSTSIVSSRSVRRACWRFRRTHKTFEKTAHRNVFHNMLYTGSHLSPICNHPAPLYPRFLYPPKIT